LALPLPFPLGRAQVRQLLLFAICLYNMGF
jgi:hypothetical protein